MTEEQKLKKLLEIIGDLIRVEGNEWLVEDLLAMVEKNADIGTIANNPVIQRIHEYCIEDRLQKQASEFYKEFPVPEIVDQLIADYMKMEHERRRDNFEGFCFAMFQQIEAIVNWVHEKYVLPEWDNIKGTVVVDYYNMQSAKQVKKSLQEEVLGKSAHWDIFPKFKSVNFVYCSDKKVPLSYLYKVSNDLFYELKESRNTSHRGGTKSSSQQQVLDRIKDNEAGFYMKFYGYLFEFVRSLKSSLPVDANEAEGYSSISRAN
jgi:hypothetical protein